MPLILFHSSKTMRAVPHSDDTLRQPALLNQAVELSNYLKTLTQAEIAKTMHISESTASKTSELINRWGTRPEMQTQAIDCFLGDMYSGLQAPSLSSENRQYADDHLRIISGLYGVLRPLDGIMPYRMEMGYKLLKPPYDDPYSYWTDAIADQLPSSQIVFNLSSVEYTKTLLPFLTERIIITPVFLTKHLETGELRQVVVHSKIARGAFVRWLISTRCNSVEASKQFNLLGYRYETANSTKTAPVFICDKFQGKDLSLRKT